MREVGIRVGKKKSGRGMGVERLRRNNKRLNTQSNGCNCSMQIAQ